HGLYGRVCRLWSGLHWHRSCLYRRRLRDPGKYRALRPGSGGSADGRDAETGSVVAKEMMRPQRGYYPVAGVVLLLVFGGAECSGEQRNECRQPDQEKKVAESVAGLRRGDGAYMLHVQSSSVVKRAVFSV